jgi:hypothetical protein
MRPGGYHGTVIRRLFSIPTGSKVVKGSQFYIKNGTSISRISFDVVPLSSEKQDSTDSSSAKMPNLGLIFISQSTMVIRIFLTLPDLTKKELRQILETLKENKNRNNKKKNKKKNNNNNNQPQ